MEMAAAVTAEQVIEYSAHGVLRGRRGAHGVYRCEGRDQWVAVDDTVDALPATDRAAWCSMRTPEDAAAELLALGIPAAAVVPGFATLHDRQMRARGFFQAIDHPDVGEQEYPSWPMRFSAGPAVAWTGRCPTLGEHTDEVLRSIGVSDAELDSLRAASVIGTTPLAPGR